MCRPPGDQRGRLTRAPGRSVQRVRRVGRVERDQRPAAARRDVEPVGRPGRVVVAPEPRALPAAGDDVEPVGVGDEQPPAGRQREVGDRCRRRLRGGPGRCRARAARPPAPAPLSRWVTTIATSVAASAAQTSGAERRTRPRGRACAWAASTVRRARSRAGPASGGSVSRSARSRAASSSRVIAPTSARRALAFARRRASRSVRAQSGDLLRSRAVIARPPGRG